MVAKVLVVIVTLLVVYNAQGQSSPVIEDSFIAWGEIVQPVPETDDLIILQTAFEESYDASTKNAAFFLRLFGKNLTFVKNYATNQTFMYMENNDTKLQCTETNEKEWALSDFGPGLLAFEEDDGTVKFSLTQLFKIPEKHLSDKLRGVPTLYRGIPAKSWTYVIKTRDSDNKYDATLTIESYWSDGTWNTSSGQKVTPLGFNVTRTTWSKPVVTEDYVINVFGFVSDAYDHKYFEPFQGIVCASRKSTLKFPNVKDIKAISLHSEMALPDYQEVRYIDTWFDPSNQLVRIDVERMKDEDPMERMEKRYQSEIAIGKMGVVYRWGYYKGKAECEILPFDKYKNDLQNLFDIKQDLKGWKMGKIFGLNDTSYVYIGQTTKNDVPCHLFQGMRTDWPDKSSKYKSLWEWCFNVNMSRVNDIVMFQDDEFGLISANVIIVSDPNKAFNNYRMNHHFYEVKAQDPKILDATSFDIGRCYRDTQKKALQFYLDVDVGSDNKNVYENATSDVSFLQKWKAAIYNNSGLPDYSLRISDVRATIDENKVYIKFFILLVHDDLPADIKKNQINATTAEINLRNKINEGKVSIQYQWTKGKTSNVAAERSSLSLQMDPKFEPQTLQPLPSTTPTVQTPFPFSLITEPDDNKSTTTDDVTDPGNNSTDVTDTGNNSTKPEVGTTTPPPDEKNKHIVKYTGHQPGAVAGVSIAMLLVGITIGSSGTFYKFNGLPACLKR